MGFKPQMRQEMCPTCLGRGGAGYLTDKGVSQEYGPPFSYEPACPKCEGRGYTLVPVYYSEYS